MTATIAMTISNSISVKPLVRLVIRIFRASSLNYWGLRLHLPRSFSTRYSQYSIG
jgi:hypothetical protein